MDFENLYRTYSQKIFRVCLGYFNDADKAKDITQDVFLIVYENLKNLKHQKNISGWIYRIASNRCLRQLENEKQKHFIDEYEFLNLDEVQNTLDEANFVKLHQHISTLSEMDRLIIGFYLEDLSQKKIAEIVGLSHTNIRVRIHRIKEFLTKKMKNDAE